jgi:HEAT repeat protein
MKNLVVTTVLAVVLLAASVPAQKRTVDLKKTEIENLLIGIRSDNPGLKKSSVYMAGKYELDECTGSLIEQLKTEKDASVKVLIALALYRIGSEEGMEAIEELAHNDNNKEVRRMSSAIVNQWQEDNNNKTVVLR